MTATEPGDRNCASQLAILHDRTLYFLRQTRYGKLTLTK